MKRIKYLLLIMLMLLTVNVKAANNCDTKEYNRLKELAKKIEFDYEYTINGEDVDFKITATNLNKDLKVLILENYYENKYREFKGSTTGSLNGFKSGERVVITIKGYVPNGCSGVTVLTKTIKIPYYNWFYDEERCEGNEDFKYCSRIVDNNISRSEFEKQFNNYIQKKVKDIVDEDEKKQAEENNKGINEDLIMIILGGIAILAIISVVVVAFIKKREKNKL